jgi:hypothetical protein
MLIAFLLAAAQPALAQATTPEQMLSQVNRDSPEDEEQAAIRAAEQHPLGTLANPIRVGGPEGEHAYLGRLRCPDGSTPHIGARGDGGVGGFGTVTGVYPVQCAGAESRLVFDMYHEEHSEDRAPAGFSLSR